MPFAHLGELAALATAVCWSFGSVFFTLAARALGSNVVNRLRIALALFFLMITHMSLSGQLIPLHATPQAWFWFALSGFIGYTIGDTLLFRSFVLVGPRISMLMMALAPVIGAVFAWIFLNEYLAAVKIAAIIVTLTGIGLVVTERGPEEGHGRKHWSGILFGVGAAAGQALGLLTSKLGLNSGLSPVSGNLIRLIAGTVTMWFAGAVLGQIPLTFRSFRNRRALLAVVAGSILGPFVGVVLSLVAIQHSYIGVASTIMALPPVLLIPLSRFVFKERISWRGVIGTVIALAGVALLFLL